MRFDVLTLFPEIFAGYLTQSLLKLAIDRGLVRINLWNIRDWARGKHRGVDDRPFGGGPGMVIMPGPVFDAVEAVRAKDAEPGLLLSGNHPAITRWRREQSLARSRPPDPSRGCLPPRPPGPENPTTEKEGKEDEEPTDGAGGKGGRQGGDR